MGAAGRQPQGHDDAVGAHAAAAPAGGWFALYDSIQGSQMSQVP